MSKLQQPGGISIEQSTHSALQYQPQRFSSFLNSKQLCCNQPWLNLPLGGWNSHFLVQNLILVVVDSSTFLPSNLKRMQLQTQLLVVFSWFDFSTRESKRTPLQRLLFGFAPRSYSSSLCSGFCSTQKSGGFQFYILHNSIFQIWQKFDYLPNCRHSATKGFGRLLTRIRNNQVHPHTVRIWKGKAVSCICIEYF